jgi:acetyl-CoA carboxylase carboxyltransferase component
MQDNRSFEEFLQEWRASRIVALGGEASVSLTDRDLVAEQRARELTELAFRHGFRDELSKAARPYRSVTDYVKALYDSAEHRAK